MPNERANDKFIHLKSADYKPGTVFAGKYMGTYVDKMYGDTRYMLKTAKGNMLVFKGLKQIKDIFEKAKKGDTVAFKYIEKIKLDDGRSLQKFEQLDAEKAAKLAPEPEPEEKDDDSMPF